MNWRDDLKDSILENVNHIWDELLTNYDLPNVDYYFSEIIEELYGIVLENSENDKLPIVLVDILHYLMRKRDVYHDD